jgi:hypothetical protein
VLHDDTCKEAEEDVVVEEEAVAGGEVEGRMV